ncbi:MAG: HAMP domain-containing sensor histidine kinase [Candidatus Eremiobacteraeota bacterium]|nr:HAMP domain-containing sensor histidine kinase [Candidatus Eremiobacteraeota bacterium]
MKKLDKKGWLHKHIILLGIVFAALYWLLQSAMKAFILYEDSFARELCPSSTEELWLRTLVVTLLLMFATFVQVIITRLNRAEEALRRAREDFVAILTHDLKGPLSSIMAYTQLIISPKAGGISAEKISFARSVLFSSEEMMGMIQNMANVSRIEGGFAVELHREPFPLKALIDEMEKNYEPLAEQSGLSLEFLCPGDVVVDGDRVKLRQVFHNLLSNALRYTPRGGQISVKVSADNGRADVEVGDTGKGIPRREQKGIFNKYSQVKGDRRSTGLGLFIVKSFLESHGAEITLESDEGRGTKFFFSLPMACGEGGRDGPERNGQ